MQKLAFGTLSFILFSKYGVRTTRTLFHVIFCCSQSQDHVASSRSAPTASHVSASCSANFFLQNNFIARYEVFFSRRQTPLLRCREPFRSLNVPLQILPVLLRCDSFSSMIRWYSTETVTIYPEETAQHKLFYSTRTISISCIFTCSFSFTC